MYTTTNRTERKRSLHRLALVAVTFTILVPSSLANAQVYEPGSIVDDKGIGEWLSSYANWIESEPPVPGTNRAELSQPGPVLFVSGGNGTIDFEVPADAPLFYSRNQDL